MGTVVDLVPNHMSLESPRANPWWTDVLENGPSSPYARFFDVDWAPVKRELAGKVLLPILGDQYGRVLERGELELVFRDGALCVRYGDRELPINPRQTPRILRQGLEALRAELGDDDPDVRELLSILTELANLPAIAETEPARVAERQREKEVARERLARLTARAPRIGAYVAACVRAANGRAGHPASFDALHALLEAQAYRLAHWRTAFHEINYRRFFDVNALIGLRMEEPEVFAAAHALAGELVCAGTVTGVRIDHLDGLFDPRQYLERLRDALGVYTVAEKILAPGETLPPEWPLDGTTGYDFLNDVAGLFVDGRNAVAMRRAWERFTGTRARFDDVVYASKRDVMESTLASELNVLAHALNRISEADRRSRDFTLQSLHDMLREFVACFPVYRTYVSPAGHSEPDLRLIESAIARARRRNPATNASIFDFLRDVLLDRPPPGLGAAERSRRIEFAMRLQQYTGPVQAKGVEDTAFYRYHVLVSLNEVGGAPEWFGRTPAEFHAANRLRRARWPHAMLCTATHDTKRGEDARARISVLSELPGEWAHAAARWARLNGAHRTALEDRWAPDRNDEYLFYQTLVGIWPAGDAAPAALVPRLRTYMTKAIREAKVHTSWISEDAAYEEGVLTFVERTLAGPRSGRFLDAFVPFARRIARLGAVGALAQLVLKLVAPGVPDVYQGTELWDLHLVDPDNRRPVDYATRTAALDALAPLLHDPGPADRVAAVARLVQEWEDGRIKLLVTACGLRLRRALAAVFRDGDYLPLEVRGAHADHVVALARTHADAVVIAVVPRLVAALADGAGVLRPEAWEDTRVVLPAALARAPLRDALTGVACAPVAGALALGEILRVAPVAILRG
jgi:(1->4)-alpha-D-glucan 1-alpha-D-glucosylmutase